MFTDYIKDMGTNEDNYNVTILIAEDEESNFLLLKTILKRHCNVLQARTGLELLKVFAEKGADLILLDIKMPEMNGIEALKEIRKKDTNIPIIMQSAYLSCSPPMPSKMTWKPPVLPEATDLSPSPSISLN